MLKLFLRSQTPRVFQKMPKKGGGDADKDEQ